MALKDVVDDTDDGDDNDNDEDDESWWVEGKKWLVFV